MFSSVHVERGLPLPGCLLTVDPTRLADFLQEVVDSLLPSFQPLSGN